MTSREKTAYPLDLLFFAFDSLINLASFPLGGDTPSKSSKKIISKKRKKSPKNQKQFHRSTRLMKMPQSVRYAEFINEPNAKKSKSNG